jgi:hypothetical protein
MEISVDGSWGFFSVQLTEKVLTIIPIGRHTADDRPIPAGLEKITNHADSALPANDVDNCRDSMVLGVSGAPLALFWPSEHSGFFFFCFGFWGGVKSSGWCMVYLHV